MTLITVSNTFNWSDLQVLATKMQHQRKPHVKKHCQSWDLLTGKHKHTHTHTHIHTHTHTHTHTNPLTAIFLIYSVVCWKLMFQSHQYKAISIPILTKWSLWCNELGLHVWHSIAYFLEHLIIILYRTKCPGDQVLIGHSVLKDAKTTGYQTCRQQNLWLWTKHEKMNSVS